MSISRLKIITTAASAGLILSPMVVFAAVAPVPPTAPSLPTVDPQARQVLAAMVNTYNGSNGLLVEEYADEENIQAKGNTTAVSARYINSRFTVALSKGTGMLLTATDASGAKVTVHAFQKNSQNDRSFLVITADSRFPGLFVKDIVTNYEEAQAHSFGRVGLDTLGAGVLFSERDVGSLLLHPAFQGLRIGQPLAVDGIPCDTVTIELDNERGSNMITLCIDQKDHLLRRLAEVHVLGDQTTTVTENHTRIRTRGFPQFPSLFPSSYFRYAPPRGARQVTFFPSATVPAPPAATPPAPLRPRPKP